MKSMRGVGGTNLYSQHSGDKHRWISVSSSQSGLHSQGYVHRPCLNIKNKNMNSGANEKAQWVNATKPGNLNPVTGSV